MSKFHGDGLLDLSASEAFETCKLPIIDKLTKTPFEKIWYRASDLLELIHSDVCGLMSMKARGIYEFFSLPQMIQYIWISLPNGIAENFGNFKEFQREVQNQFGKNIELLRSDRGGKYMSHELIPPNKECE
jgi:hypothetical protein